MKFTKIFVSALLASTVAGSAFAADLPSRKEAPVYVAAAPIMTWTGFYIGLNAGYTWSGNNNVGISAFDTGGAGFAFAQARGGLPTTITFNNNGFIGGGQVGYNWQAGSLVAGVEADIQAIASSTKSAAILLQGVGVVPITTTATKGQSYLGTVRGRLGFTVAPTLLLYGTGGLAYGDTKTSIGVVCPTCGPAYAGIGSIGGTSVGWTIGGGAEWMFAPNWTVRAEYLYYDLGRKTVSTPAYFYGANASVVTSTTRFTGNVVRAGINYKFGWGAAPVVAKY